jgi:hypothetical protein
MEFQCSLCDYKSTLKSDVVRHINKKKQCCEGQKEVIEVKIEIRCNNCNKKYATKASLKEHIKNYCKKKDQEIKGLKELNEENLKMKDEIEELKKQMNNIMVASTTGNITLNTTNNITDNSTTYNIIMINNYKDTDVSNLDDSVYNKIITKSEEVYHIIPDFIDYMHYNKDMPKNHNVYLPNRGSNNKYLLMYVKNDWQPKDIATEVGNIVSDKENIVSDWVGLKRHLYPKAAERFDEYMEQRSDIKKVVEEEVIKRLYVGRNIVKETINRTIVH